MFNKSLWSSTSGDWSTPEDLYRVLDTEFHFTLDPCPLDGVGGLEIEWAGSVYVNPPYGRQIIHWVRKGYDSAKTTAEVVVMLLPSRTDTGWWHDYVMKGEIRFIRGRLKFGQAVNNAPFPSAIVIFRRDS